METTSNEPSPHLNAMVLGDGTGLRDLLSPADSMILWHSSPYTFRRFNTEREGAHFGTREQACNLRKAGKKAAKPYRVNIQNAIRLPDLGTWTVDGIAYALHMADITSTEENEAIYAERNWTDERAYAKIKAILKAKGFDGIVYANEVEGDGDSYLAFYSNQILAL